MNAAPLLTMVARILAQRRLNAVLIENAAAALQGSPITTLDLDFLIRKTPTNLKKLKLIAEDLEAMILRPFYLASGLYRIVRDTDGLQLDFMTKIYGIRAFESLRSHADVVRFGEAELRVASLHDIIRSKEAANRPQDRAVLPVLRRTLREKEKAG